MGVDLWNIICLMVRTSGNGKGPERKINKSKIAKLIVFILLIAIVIATIVIYNKNEEFRNVFDKYVFRKEVKPDNLVTIDLEANKESNVFAHNKYIVILNQNSLEFYNRTGNKEQSLEVQISTPIFEGNNNYLYIAEKNGQRIYCIQNKNILWHKDIEGEIKALNVNKNGYVSIIIAGTSYKSIIETYDNTGKELFKRGLSTTSVIDTDISDDNKYLAIAEADFSGVLVQSKIEILSIESASKNSDDAVVYTYQPDSDNLVINIQYQKDNLACMYDKFVEIIKNKNTTRAFEFSNETVLFADVNLNSKIIKVIKKSEGFLGKAFQMQIIDTNKIGNVITYEIEQNPKKVYISDNIICINIGTEVLFVNSNGWLIKRYKSSKEVQNVIFNSNIAGVISKGKIELISL